MHFDYRKYRQLFTADFETSTEAWNVEEARVWLWDICDSKLNHYTGTTLDSFMGKILKTACNNLYGFRNLAYDGVYILSWLLNHGYKHTNNETNRMRPKTFKAVISGLGSHYAYAICNEIGQHVTITDTLKYVNMSIAKSAECYKLPIKKGTIDYDMFRPIGYEPTQDEIEYIHNDTEIDMRTIQLNMEAGAYKFTQAGNARYEFKSLFTDGEWDFLFPQIDLQTDKFLRKAYAGGFVSYNKEYKDKTVFNCHSLDINSMYPAQMLHKPMPYGFPLGFSGKYIQDDNYPLYVQKLSCCFKLKPNGIAMISTKKTFVKTENLYLESSGITKQVLTLANPDLELFFENYDVFDIEWLGGFKFQAMQGREITPQEASAMTVDECIEADGKGSYFYEYIKKWRYIKEHEPSGSALRDYAKRMQNALYGALATSPERKSSVPKLDESGKVVYELVNSVIDGSPAYLPAGIFITAWSRHFLIKTIMKYKKYFIYCDTDSLYLKGLKPLPDFAVHKSLYGFFKLEHYITMLKVVGAKRYIYYGREPKHKNDSFCVTCCGADGDIKKQFTFNNFVTGNTFYGKKSVHNVKGGKHLYITTYRLGKEPKAV